MSTVTQITRAHWVNNYLPQLDIRANAYQAVHPSSTSTRDHPCPSIFLAMGTNHLQQLLAGPIIQSVLSDLCSPLVAERSHLLKVEGDVERATHLYLAHEMNLIFKEYLSRRPAGHTAFSCSSQVYLQSSRIDITWKVNDKPVMVLELKRCNALHLPEWATRTIRIDPSVALAARPARIQSEAASALARLQLERKNNCTHISKQAAKYALQHRVPIVVVFDWVNMIMLDMKPLQTSPGYSDTTSPVEILVSQEGTTPVGQQCEWTHRKVLLVAFLRALQKLNI
ncbi:hypothetical protein C8R43DRAFT_1177516 [Mycena crocata]|nr:hypothetical protein C8R43DRAFT_1177516 [Mycena crocata]